MPTKKQVLEEIDDDLRHIKTDLDAAKEWTRVASRIADALEHQSVSQALMQLSAMGLQVDMKNIAKPKHLVTCPVCVIGKNVIIPDKSSLITHGSAIDQMNGIPIIGEKKG